MPFSPTASQENHWNPGAGTKQVSYLGDAPLALGCPTAWDTTLGSQSVYVCVISDKGVDLTHPDLIKAPNHNLGTVTTGATGPTQGAPTATTPADAYGTAVAGVAAANLSTTNGQIIGVAPNVGIYSLRPPNINPPALATSLALIVAQDFVAPKTPVTPPPVPLPSNPAGGPGFIAANYHTIRRVALLPVPLAHVAWAVADSQAVTDALAAGVVVVIASGHDAASANANIVDETALRTDVIVVGANTSAGTGNTHSRKGPSVCCVARGAPVWVGDLQDVGGANATAGIGGNADDTFADVTAVAAAQAAGVAALVLSANPRLTPADVRRILRESCEGSAAAIDPVGILGFGQLRADLAVAKAIQQRADVVVLGSGIPLECNFGDVELGATLDKIIELRLNVAGSLSPVTYSVGALPTNVTAVTGGGFEDPTALITVAGAPKQLKLRVTVPSVSATGLVTTSLLIHSDDDQIGGTSGNFSITVKYNVVTIKVVDTVLVLDRSGSMSEAADGGVYRKVDVLIDAAKLYADKQRDTDRLGIVSFDHQTEALLATSIDTTTHVGTGLVVAGNPATTSMRAHLKARITDGVNDLGPRGSTSIGGGIQAGGTLLATQAPAPRYARVLFVFTDGLQNYAPDVMTGLGSVPADARIFAIRAGLSSNSAGDSFFDDLTTVTASKGWATNVGTDLMNIQKLFIKVLVEAADGDFAGDPEFSLAPGQRVATDVPIGEVDIEADFVVLYRASESFPKYLRVWLELPDGTNAQFQDIAAGSVPGMQAIFDSGHVILRCKFPANPAAPRAHVGIWKIWVENGLNFDNGEYKSMQRVGGKEVLTGTTLATVRSNLRLTGRLTQSAFVPGTPLTITLEPTAYGLAITPSSAPDVRVVRPDGVAFSLPVTRTAQGSYVGTWTDTGLLGTYQFSANMKVQTVGALLSRSWTGSSLIRPVVPIVPDAATQYADAVKESVVPLPPPGRGGPDGHGGGPGGYGDCRRPPYCKHGGRRPYEPCPCCAARGGCDCCAHSCRCDCHPHGAHALLHKLACLLRR